MLVVVAMGLVPSLVEAVVLGPAIVPVVVFINIRSVFLVLTVVVLCVERVLVPTVVVVIPCEGVGPAVDVAVGCIAVVVVSAEKYAVEVLTVVPGSGTVVRQGFRAQHSTETS